MPITGSWAQRQAVQSGSLKWGTGWNPVHAVRAGGGRNTTPQGNTGWVDENITDESYVDFSDPNVTPMEDQLVTDVYGYGPDTGTSDRPRWNELPEEHSLDIEGFPSWGQYQAGLPGGSAIRAQDHGGEQSYVSRNPVEDSAAAGWFNKRHTEVNLPVTSDSAQYEMTASMQQRDKTRTGSQSAGRANAARAPIGSRPGAMKDRAMLGSPDRWYDMEPREQIPRIRPWWPRQAGTGPRSRMAPNSMYASQPMTRQPPSIPDQGPTVGSGLSGWTDEDGGWY